MEHILHGVLAKFFMELVDKEQELELAQDRTVLHILKWILKLVVKLVVLEHGAAGHRQLEEYKKDTELVRELTAAHILTTKLDVLQEALQHVELVVENPLLEKLVRLQQ